MASPLGEHDVNSQFMTDSNNSNLIVIIPTAAHENHEGLPSHSSQTGTEPFLRVQSPVEESSTHSTPESSSNSVDAATLFVAGLNWRTTCQSFRQYFEMFGSVKDVDIKGSYGFVVFAKSETTEKVLNMPKHTLDGNIIDPKRNISNINPERKNTIFLGGISQDTSSVDVVAYFGQFGKVEKIKLVTDYHTMRHCGYGFLTFENDEVADRMCAVRFHIIKNKKVECKMARWQNSLKNVVLPVRRKRLMATPSSVAPSSSLVAAQTQASAVAAQNVTTAAVAAQNATPAAVAAQNAAPAAFAAQNVAAPAIAAQYAAPAAFAAQYATPAAFAAQNVAPPAIAAQYAAPAAFAAQYATPAAVAAQNAAPAAVAAQNAIPAAIAAQNVATAAVSAQNATPAAVAAQNMAPAAVAAQNMAPAEFAAQYATPAAVAAQNMAPAAVAAQNAAVGSGMQLSRYRDLAAYRYSPYPMQSYEDKMKTTRNPAAVAAQNTAPAAVAAQNMAPAAVAAQNMAPAEFAAQYATPAAVAAQNMAPAAVAAQNAAVGSGMQLSRYPDLAAYRYSPYPMQSYEDKMKTSRNPAAVAAQNTAPAAVAAQNMAPAAVAAQNMAPAEFAAQYATPAAVAAQNMAPAAVAAQNAAVGSGMQLSRYRDLAAYRYSPYPMQSYEDKMKTTRNPAAVAAQNTAPAAVAAQNMAPAAVAAQNMAPAEFAVQYATPAAVAAQNMAPAAVAAQNAAVGSGMQLSRYRDLAAYRYSPYPMQSYEDKMKTTRNPAAVAAQNTAPAAVAAQNMAPAAVAAQNMAPAEFAVQYATPAAVAAQNMAPAAVAAQNAAVGSGMQLSRYRDLAAYRYSPYPMQSYGATMDDTSKPLSRHQPHKR